jgi:putative ABC transport system permease protein
VEQIELRLTQPASMFVSGRLVKEAGIGTSIMGIPADSSFFRPLMIRGRWFAPGDGRVIVITRQTALREKIQIGDQVRLDLGDLGEGEWQVVGVYEPVFASGFVAETIYAPLDSLYRAIRRSNLGSQLYVRTTSHSAEFQASVTDELKALFERRGLKVEASQTESALRSQFAFQFSTITSMLLGLASSSRSSVDRLDGRTVDCRRRADQETGCCAYRGSPTILSIFVMEGLLQGLLSWSVSIPIALVVAPLAARALGNARFGATLDYRFAWSAVGTWLIAILLISTLASLLPARGATRISVRDSLAYA